MCMGRKSLCECGYLFDLSSQHAALDSEHCGDVNVLSTHGVHPHSQAVDGGKKEHPRELDDVEDTLDDVVCQKRENMLIHLHTFTHTNTYISN